VEKLLADNKDKIGESEARDIEAAVADARKAAQGDDAAALKASVERLTKLSHQVAETLYKKTGSAPGGPAAGASGNEGSGGAASDVVDAEYTVKN